MFKISSIFTPIPFFSSYSGDKFAYVSHFIKPCDTKHHESQLFFNNELLSTPFYEIVPLEAVVGRFYVLDLETYRMGKPKGKELLFIDESKIIVLAF